MSRPSLSRSSGLASLSKMSWYSAILASASSAEICGTSGSVVSTSGDDSTGSMFPVAVSTSPGSSWTAVEADAVCRSDTITLSSTGPPRLRLFCGGSGTKTRFGTKAAFDLKMTSRQRPQSSSSSCYDLSTSIIRCYAERTHLHIPQTSNYSDSFSG